ncbi:MAG: hypothetical protein K6G07_01245 [Lachnospiraceae bacterium]|nr:hypothetical protein [Lachnospiraceae bacterium]
MALEIGLILCAIFELICVPVTFAGGSLWTVTGLWLFFGVVLSALYIRLGRKHLAPQPEGSTKRFGCGLIEDVKKAWKERDVVTVFLAVFLLIVIAVQISFFVFGTHLDADDAMYLGNATAAFETNSLFTVDPYMGGDVNFTQVKDYVLSPLSIVYASLGQIFHVSPVILAHTILPPFLILIAYLIYSMLAVRLFDKGRERLLFLCFLAVVHAMSFVTTRTPGAVLLLRIWQGKAIVCSILLPLLFVWFLDFLKGKNVWF